MKGMNGMVELKEKVIHNNTYDIDIQQYLTYAQIQQIVNAVEMARKMIVGLQDRLILICLY